MTILAPDPPSLNTWFLADPYSPGSISSPTYPSISNTSITIDWIAPPGPSSPLITADGAISVLATATVTLLPVVAKVTAISSITASCLTGFFPGSINPLQVGVQADFSTPGSISNATFPTIGSTSVTVDWSAPALFASVIQLAWNPPPGLIGAYGNIIMANGWQSSDTLPGLRISASMSSQTFTSGRSTIFGMSATATTTSGTNVSGSATFAQIKAAISLTLRDVASSSTTLLLFKTFGAATVLNISSGLGTISKITSVAHAVAPLGATELSAFFNLSCIASANFGFTSIGLSKILNVLATSSMSSLTFCSGTSVGLTISSSIQSTQTDVLTSQPFNPLLLNVVASASPFNTASAIAYLFNQTASGTISDTAYGIAQLPSPTLIGISSQGLLASGSAVLFGLLCNPVIQPFLLTDGITNLQLLSDTTNIELRADVFQLDAVLSLDVSTASTINGISASANSLLSNGAHLASTVAALSTSANAGFQVLASQINTIKYIVVASLLPQPILAVSNINFGSIVSAILSSPAVVSATIPFTSIASAYQSNQTTSIIAIETLFASASAMVNLRGSFAGAFPLSAIATVLWSNIASGTNTVERLISTSAAINTFNASTSVTIPLTCTASAIQQDNAQGVASFNLTVNGSALGNFVASAAVDINLSVSATGEQELFANTTNSILLSASGLGAVGYVSHGTGYIKFVAAGNLEVFGSFIEGTTSIDLITASAMINQNGNAYGVVNWIITADPSARLWLTPPGFVEGDMVVYWSD